MSTSGRRAGAPALLVFLIALTACDPCSGVSTCAVEKNVSAVGRIVDVASGRPVPGTRVSIVRSGGVPIDSGSAVTDAEGLYRLSLFPGAVTNTPFDVIVSPPDKPPYRVRNVNLPPSTVHGDARILGEWVSEPYFAEAIEFYYRGKPDRIIPNVFGIFRRTGGANLAGPGWQRDLYFQVIDSFGRFTMFNNQVVSLDSDEVVGNVEVYLLAPLELSFARNVRLRRQYQYGLPVPVLRRGAGPSLAYVGRFVNRATRAPVRRVRATFQRTGGIAVENESFTSLSNAGGEFVFRLNPLGIGTVIGDLTVRPGPPDTGFVLRGIALKTFDDDGGRFFAEWGVGPHLPWLGIVKADGRPIAGVEVEARRVGGIAVTPEVMTVRSDANGYFPLFGFVPGASGQLIVDLVFRPPPPYQPLTVRNVAMPTFNVDSDGRFIGEWNLTSSSPARGQP